jgi:large subunit ribosomal protein L35Ae
MEGTIVNYRSSMHRQRENYVVVVVKGVDSLKKASELTGKKAVWTSPAKKEIKGVVKGSHGNKGAVKIHFEKGLPGQSIGGKVKIE